MPKATSKAAITTEKGLVNRLTAMAGVEDIAHPGRAISKDLQNCR